MKTKEKILMACEELTIKKSRGFYNLSMEELAQEAGVSKRTIYRHFANKEELFEAAIDKITDEIIAKNMELLGSEKDMKIIIVGLLRNISYLVSQQFISDLSTYYPLLWQKIERIREKKMDILINCLLNNSQVKMRFRVDAKIFKASLIAAMTVVLSPSFIVESGLSFEEVGYQFLNMFIFGGVEPIPEE